MKFLSTVILLIATVIVSLASAQEGPAPPRLNIPGAIPIPLRPQFRNEKLGPVLRVRRPVARPIPVQQQSNFLSPQISPRLLEETKPVTEEPEDSTLETFVPQILQHQQPIQPSPPTFFAEPNALHQDPNQHEEQQQISIPRFQDRPAPQRISTTTEFPNLGGQRFALERQRPQQRQSRPPVREPRPQYEQHEQTIPVQRPAVRAHNIQPRPIDTNNLNHVQHDGRQKKPVSQILRKYRDEHEDGTITWGYENDDGSFKEEIIGTDCVTRGTYGYIDPDGNKREYNYETGIKCDPNKKGGEDSEELEQTGFVNYEENRAVLPNGLEIDLASMGKKKSKRPGAILHQNQPQPQQFYRN